MKNRKYTTFDIEIFLLKIKPSKIVKMLRIVIKNAILSPVIKIVNKKTVKKIKKINGENLFFRKFLYSLIIVKRNIGKMINLVNHIPIWGPLKGPVSLVELCFSRPKISTPKKYWYQVSKIKNKQTKNVTPKKFLRLLISLRIQ